MMVKKEQLLEWPDLIIIKKKSVECCYSYKLIHGSV